jgi:hypothetical protein
MKKKSIHGIFINHTHKLAQEITTVPRVSYVVGSGSQETREEIEVL